MNPPTLRLPKHSNLDSDQQRLFIKLLSPKLEGFTLQTFPDNKSIKDRGLTRVIQSPTLDGLLQLHAHGAGIYATVNETDGKGRKSENITRIRAVWQEDDDGFDGAFPLHPSMVVETSPGHFHRYWLVADDWPADERGRAHFAAVMERMVENYGSDKNAKDISRVLRFPGFLHRKGETPHLVRIVEASARRYSRAEIVAAFPPVERPKKDKAQHRERPLQDGDERRIADALRHINADDRDLWVQCGMAIKDHLGDASRQLWDDWSQQSDKYNDRDQDRTWKSFKRNGISIGTLFYHAQQAGWRDERIHRSNGAERAGSGKTSASEGFDSFDSTGGSRFSEWPEPKPLPKGLPPVAAFDPDFLPDAIASWVMDITNRMQCQPDNVAVAAMTALGAVIGRRVGIKPQMNTDWVEVSNIWGAIIGRRGLIKSGAQHAGVAPLHHLEAEAAKKNAAALQAYEAEFENYKIRQQVNRQFKKDALKGEDKQLLELGAEPTPPVDIRYRTNDTSYESLGELLIGNSTGILVERDELISLLQHLDRDDQANARGFYLSGWSGQHPYTFDRILRGHRHIDAVCISVLGNTQPARISEYVRRANLGGAGGDGLIQRFGLLVWPEVPSEWENLDVHPDSVARQRVWSIFEQISKIDASEAHRLGATQDKFDKIPAFRFTDAAHAQFLEWREELERRLRSGELSPALEGHLSKYRKLVPGLALINHLADGKQGNVDVREVLRAIAYADYLETHAKRVYSSASESETAAAQAILEDGFTVRDVHRPRWSNLTEHEQVANGLNLLVDFGYLAETELGTKPQGGRPKTVYAINPGLRA